MPEQRFAAGKGTSEGVAAFMNNPSYFTSSSISHKYHPILAISLACAPDLFHRGNRFPLERQA